MSTELLDKVKGQLRDITDLYDKERDKSNHLEQTIRDLRRREPLVQMLWQEVQLLRKILERHLQTSSVQMNLPSGRLNNTQREAIATPMTDKDRIAYLALRLIQSDQANQGISTEDLVRDFAPQMDGQAADGDWLKSDGALGAGNCRLSVMRKDASNRLDGIKAMEQDLDHLHGQGPNKDITFAEAAGLDSTEDNLPKSPFAAAIADAARKKAAGEPVERGAATGPGTVGADGHEYDANGIPKAPQDLFDGIPFGAKGTGAAGAAGAAAPVKTGPQPSKTMIKPRLKMKPFHWKQIIIGAKGRRSSVASRSIWQDVDGLYESILSRNLNQSEFESKFQSAPLKSDGSAAKEVEEEVVDDKPRRLLDAKRHNQLSFMLSKMPNFELLKKAILTLDSSVIPADKLEALHKNIPTSEEIAHVTSCGLPPSKLQLPEQWILVMATIPQLSARIECWRFSQTFDEQYVELHKPLARIETACSAIRNSQSLKRYLAIVLAVGNYMNGGTPRGQADGFTMESLSKIARIKNAEGDGSLLDFVNSIAEDMYGDSFFDDLSQELSLISEVRAISLKQISGEGRKLASKSDLVHKMQSLVAAQAAPNDPFERVMSDFNESASRKVKSLEGLCRTIFTSFVNLMLYFDPSLDVSKAEQVNTEEFFASLDDFTLAVIRSQREYKRKRELAEARIKQAQQMQALKKAASGTADTAPRAKPRRTVFNSSGAPMVQLRSTAGATNSNDASTSADTSNNSGNPFNSGFPKLKPVNRDGDKSTNSTNQSENEPTGNPFARLKPVDRTNENNSANSKSTNSSADGTFVFAKLKPVNREETQKSGVSFAKEEPPTRMVQLKSVKHSEVAPKIEPKQQESVKFSKDTKVTDPIPSNISASSMSSMEPMNGMYDSDSDITDSDDDLPPPPPEFDEYPDSDSD